MAEETGENLPRLVEVMQRLLAPGGCPWDREQTPESLRAYVVEEAHEVVDAIDRRDPDLLREELGDLLLQVVFLSELARAEGWFGPNQVVDGICEKLIRRHPHVFGDEASSGTSEEQVARWEQIKRQEKKDRGTFDGLPKTLPALLRAVRVGERAAAVGFDWPDAAGPRAKIDEELRELDEAWTAGDEEAASRELGDLLFALASWARKTQTDPEAALRGSLERFAERFAQLEGRVAASGTSSMRELSDADLDALWETVKRNG